VAYDKNGPSAIPARGLNKILGTADSTTLVIKGWKARRHQQQFCDTEESVARVAAVGHAT